MAKAEVKKTTKASSPSKETKSKGSNPEEKSTGKKTSPYTAFMKTEIPKVKAGDAALSHKEAFKQAAKNWATSDKNPKNAASK
ncbi:hypothetical protein HK099_007171 [Clydaea vesicula]|uniref:YABBY protein C-terminal domain-containing protein n=1 Tax=Clydaea vesicula TaxID=447962 RepID=A0AAD5TXE3_9FUNG|nr:hypothetical protein HK099_007171 [Clydaea vesicula]KAJ3395654.1 hypothetical protein HDU92_005280 [Lobulomyces angularis]